MNLKSFSCLLIAATGMVSSAWAQQYTITNFANSPTGSVNGDWALSVVDGTTSLLSGNNSVGNSITGGSGTFSFAGATHISITGSTNNTAFPNSSLLFLLNDLLGNTASAVFSWDSLGSNLPAVSPLTSLGSFDITQLINWQLVSVYPNNQPAGPINLQLTNMSALGGALPAQGVGGPLVSGATSFVIGSETQNGVGDFVGGNSTLQNYSNATQISITASATLQGNGLAVPFTYVLIDNTGAQAYAAFDWVDFSNGVTTVSSQIIPDGFFNAANVVSWQIVSGPNESEASVNIYGVAGLSPAQTDTVIDDFSDPVAQFVVSSSGNLNGIASSNFAIAGFDNALRQIQNQITGFGNGTSEASVQVANGNYLLVTTNTQDTDNSITYDDFSLYATEQHFLRFDFSSVQNLDSLLVQVGNPNEGNIQGVFDVPDSLFASSSFFIDLSQLQGWSLEFASGISFLNVEFFTSSGNMLVELDQIAFSSIPEPSSAAMIVIGLSALMANRRRRRAQ